ncbi:sigma 54-interacting transcriptional regulator [Sorangium sp. So ce131]|uniref:sigma 54-interacting transcriptional regulator n=1 Tax=Sorangium sp. So ce131 TaxID=3133282 RepID=UPI003F5E1040
MPLSSAPTREPSTTATSTASEEPESADSGGEMSWSLSVVHHPEEGFLGARKPLPSGAALSLGRDDPCLGEGCLSSSRISRHHAALVAHADHVRLEDKGSRNGTYVNGERVTDGRDLVGGEVLSIGPVLLLVHRAPLRFDVPKSTLLVGRSHALARVLRQIELFAPGAGPVLLRGETGTGKELAAREIHEKSGRAGAFQPVNCGGLAGEVLHSELFGHVRGAFTGALRDRPGLFASADRGTAFLDEIGDAPANVQVSLLRFLDDHRVTPLGGDSARKVDARVVAASNVDFEGMIAGGRFREDLYARLSGCTIRLPPLRERVEDIPLLVRHFVRAFAGRDRPVQQELMLAMLLYRWPRNIRELAAVIRRAVLEAPAEDPIRGSPELMAELRRSARAAADPAPPGPRARARAGAAPEAEGSPRPDAAGLRELLERYQGNVASTAAHLRVSRNTLYRWLKELDVSVDDYRPQKP